MNNITQAFFSTLLLSGFAYGMNESMSWKEFSTKCNQFQCFNLTPTNKDEFETLHQDLINHIDKDDKIYRSFKGLINGTYNQKIQMLRQEFIHYNGSTLPHDQLNQVKNNLFQPHRRRPEIAAVLPNQYVFDAELGVLKYTNNNNEN